MIAVKNPKPVKIWIADEKVTVTQNLEGIAEKHSLIRLILSASQGGGRDIYKKEYYYACVQDMGSRYINSSCLYVQSTILYSFCMTLQYTIRFVCYSAVQQLKDGSNLAAHWILVVLIIKQGHHMI